MAPPPPSSESHFHSRGLSLGIISIVFTIVAVLLVISRLAARAHIGSRLVLSDFVIVLSTAKVFAIGMAVCNIIAVEHGSGKVSTTLSPRDLQITLQAFWVLQIVYKFTINLTKTSICLLYLQIFPGVNFRRITYLVMAYVLAYAIASIVATIVQCNPVARAWDRKLPGTCINLTAFWYANAAANILGDCVILVLPIPSTMALAIPRRQKYGLIIVFTLGAFVCVTSILRMTTLKTGAQAEDTIFGTLNSTIWTTIEANTGIMCACMPMLKAPLMTLFPRLFRQSNYDPREPSGPHRLPSDVTDPRSPGYKSSSGGEYGQRKDDHKPSVQTYVATGNERKSAGSSDYSGDDVGMAGNDVPLGSITETTTVDAKSKMIQPGTPRSKTSGKGHLNRASETPLVA